MIGGGERAGRCSRRSQRQILLAPCVEGTCFECLFERLQFAAGSVGMSGVVQNRFCVIPYGCDF